MIEENFYKELVEIRHYIHEHPELSEEEYKTTAFLREKLESWGINILESNLKTGFVAQIGSGKPVIALRADIDALPIKENTSLAFASKNDNVMHACGHDLHMTSLLGASKILKENEDQIKGTIKLIFQPAEEIGAGALHVLDSGLVDDVQAFLGYHNAPTMEAGQIYLREEGVMASVDRFNVEIKGIGSHAATPNEGTDTILAMTAMIQNVQSIISRNVSPLDTGVLSVTHVESGHTWNVLPDTGIFEGTIRAFDSQVRQLIKQRFLEVLESTAKAYQVSVKLRWSNETEVTYNDPALTQFLRGEIEKWHGQVITPAQSSGGEDFANYRKQAPSVFAFIGSNKPGSSGLHFSDMIVQDKTLQVAIEYYVKSAYALLEHLK